MNSHFLMTAIHLKYEEQAVDLRWRFWEMDSTWGQVVCSCSKRETDRRAEAHGRGPPRRPAKNGLTWRTISRQNRP
jgi:hypothetical protein